MSRSNPSSPRRHGRPHLAGVATTFALLAIATEHASDGPSTGPSRVAQSAADVWSRVTAQPWLFFSTISVKRPCGAWPAASPVRSSCHLPNT